MFGICTLSIVPCRKESSSTSELVTQLLFGETYKVISKSEQWLQICTTDDNYTCWINFTQHTPVSVTDFKLLQKDFIVSDSVAMIYNMSIKSSSLITAGATLPNYSNGQFSINAIEFNSKANISNCLEIKPLSQITSIATQFLNTPYLWGGRSPFGIDCSGYTQLVFKLMGVQLPRDAKNQVNIGDTLSFISEAQCGDLAFFDNEAGDIVHVGIMLNQTDIIHAYGSVRIDKLDHFGIHNVNTKKYTHTLRIIKRVIE